MNRMLAFAAVALLAAAVPAEERSSYSFAEYVVDYKKKYSGEEFVRRRSVFEENLAYIRAHNADNTQKFSLGVNKYADWTNEEFRAQRTGLNKVHLHAHVHANKHNVATNQKPVRDLPAMVDWRNKDVVSPVKDQLDCGSCWAFSAVQTIESAAAIATGRLFELSPQQVLSCSKNPNQCGGTGGCDGSTQPIAFNYTAGIAGISRTWDYPYVDLATPCNASMIKPAVGIKGHVVLPSNDYGALMNAVATEQPVAVSVAAGGIQWQLYRGGILEVNDTDIDHAVQLVGYGNSTDGAYWTVRNSWGTTWGEFGYVRLARQPAESVQCGTDQAPTDGFGCKGGPSTIKVCGTCGILSYSSYVTGAFIVGN